MRPLARALLAGPLALLLLCAPARAQATPEQLAEMLRGVALAALWQDNNLPIGPVRWGGPLVVRMSGQMSGDYADFVMATLTEMAGLARLQVRLAQGDEAATVNIRFVDTAFVFANNRTAHCLARLERMSGYRLEQVDVTINIRVGFVVRTCIVHELMHVIGLLGHPHDVDSVLSYIMNRAAMTEIDRLAIQMLYDPRLRTGERHTQALLKLRDALAERYGLDPRAPAVAAATQPWIDRTYKQLEDLAVGGNRVAMLNLAAGLDAGDGIRADPARALIWYRRMAELRLPEGFYRLGIAYGWGRAVPVDVAEAARWLRQAADHGHPDAQLALAQAIEAERGVAYDPVEAMTLYLLAARQGVAEAGRRGAALRAKLPVGQAAEAERKAAAWKPVAP